MDVTHLLDSLNDEQRAAVTAASNHILVLAGAGSGKTRVLVHRIAWMVNVEGASPYGVLAVTFTNKAAAEMRGRIESLLEIPVGGMWVGTFHGLTHRLLRAHWQEAGLPQHFQILDSDDQQRVIKRVIKALALDDAKWPPKQAQWFINARKDEGLRPQELQDHGDFALKHWISVYDAYEKACRVAGVVDFAELLLRCYELLQTRPDVLAHYRQRFGHILVDEFQDTNTIQYRWLKLLAGVRGRMFVVGDDDQSIYGWRGAKIENIQRFQQDFAGTELIRLERNYRSTGNILEAANGLIAHNTERMGKRLWTSDGEGEPILLYQAFNELDEARYIVERIKHWTGQGMLRREVAVLYRSNAQSRVLEEALLMAGVPYRVYGGLRFFERAEIKDVLAYLRLLQNPLDDAAFERVVNTPPRGIGERSVQSVRDVARDKSLSLMDAAHALIGNAGGGRAPAVLAPFVQLIDGMRREVAELPLDAQVQHVLLTSGLRNVYAQEKGEKGQARLENLDELVNAARQYEQEDRADEGLPPLASFLAHAALEAGEGQGDAWDDCVQLMTLHSAKGLEFPVVFMAGMEEGLFPHKMSMDEPGRLEEERRLCYVGMTRARKQLYMSCAEQRRMYGQESYAVPSRFVGEIPAQFIREVRSRVKVMPPLAHIPATATRSAMTPGLRLGQRVVHPSFGEGVLLSHEGEGAHARVQVKFSNQGTKWLVLAYAKLEALS